MRLRPPPSVRKLPSSSVRIGARTRLLRSGLAPAACPDGYEAEWPAENDREVPHASGPHTDESNRRVRLSDLRDRQRRHRAEIRKPVVLEHQSLAGGIVHVDAIEIGTRTALAFEKPRARRREHAEDLTVAQRFVRGEERRELPQPIDGCRSAADDPRYVITIEQGPEAGRGKRPEVAAEELSVGKARITMRHERSGRNVAEVFPFRGERQQREATQQDGSFCSRRDRHGGHRRFDEDAVLFRGGASYEVGKPRFS